MNKKIVGTVVLEDNMCDLDDFVSVLFKNGYFAEISKDLANKTYTVVILEKEETNACEQQTNQV